MKTISVDILDDKVIPLLQNLESLDVIRLHEETEKSPRSIKDLKGKMTKQSIEEVDRQLKLLRDEWN